MERKEKFRIFFSFLFFCLLFLLVLVKAFYVQVINREKLLAYSNGQLLRNVKIYPNRGSILDRNGSPLAINIDSYGIFTIPKNTKEEKENFRKLAKLVPGLNFKSIQEKTKGRKRYTWIARKLQLTDEQILKIKKLDGIYIEKESQRFYPNHELLAQVLGFVGIDNEGLSGIEYFFDEILRGRPKLTRYYKDAKGRPIKFESTTLDHKAKDIVLTIDKDIQAVTEKYLKDAVIEFGAASGGVGVMDAESGEILAMANYPTFDPNAWKDFHPDSRKISFITDPFEPGSVFKAVTISSALENKMATPRTSYYCERGRMLVNNHAITEAETHEMFEWLTVSEILQVSSNIGVTKVAFDLTYPRFSKTMHEFGFGRKTDIELPGESRGILTQAANVSPLSLSNMSFGQGLAVTGIQMLTAYSVFANGGKLVRPTIIKDESAAPPVAQIISPQTADEMEKMLIDTVEKGTGNNAIIPHFKIAGKTSTAQKVKPTGGYEGYISGFIGYAVNVDHPFVIYAYIDNPKGKYYGATVAAPVFKNIAQYILYRKKELVGLEKGLSEDTKIMDSIQTVNASTRIHGDENVPNFIGLDKISAMELVEKLRIKVKQNGVGVVTSQKPTAGEKLDLNREVELKFSPPHYD